MYISLTGDRLRLGIGSMLKRRLWGHLIAVFQYLEGAYKEAGEGLLTGACSDRKVVIRSKLKKLNLNWIRNSQL